MICLFVFFMLKLLQYCNYINIVMQIKLMLLLLQGVKSGYRGLQGVTRGYRELQGVTGRYRGLQRVPRGYKG